MTEKRIFLIAAVSLLLSGCGTKAETFRELYAKDISKVTKIDIRSGRTGELKSVTEKKVIQHFLAQLNDLEFLISRNQEISKGYGYKVTLYSPHNEFVFTEKEMNHHDYQTNPSLLALIEKLYKAR